MSGAVVETRSTLDTEYSYKAVRSIHNERDNLIDFEGMIDAKTPASGVILRISSPHTISEWIVTVKEFDALFQVMAKLKDELHPPEEDVAT